MYGGALRFRFTLKIARCICINSHILLLVVSLTSNVKECTEWGVGRVAEYICLLSRQSRKWFIGSNPIHPAIRIGDRVGKCNGFEYRRSCEWLVSSNLTLSAM